MNLHTFKDVIKSKRSSLANEIMDDDDDDAPIVLLKREVEGEEDEGNEQVGYHYSMTDSVTDDDCYL